MYVLGNLISELLITSKHYIQHHFSVIRIYTTGTVFPRIVRARSINFTVCIMRGLFEGAVYSEGATYSRKYGIYCSEYLLKHEAIPSWKILNQTVKFHHRILSSNVPQKFCVRDT